MPQPVNLFIDLRFLFNVSVARGDVGLRLVIVIIRNEIFHSIFGEKGPELLRQLRRQSLVGRDDQGWLLDFFDHIGDGESFARSRHA